MFVLIDIREKLIYFIVKGDILKKFRDVGFLYVYIWVLYKIYMVDYILYFLRVIIIYRKWEINKYIFKCIEICMLLGWDIKFNFYIKR